MNAGNLFRIVLLLGAVVIFVFGFTSNDKRNIDSESYHVRPPELPIDINFAGENVPLEYFDVIESLDRELIVNTFFHSQTMWVMKKSRRYFPIIEPILKKYNVPDDFKYLAVIESNLSNVVSPKKATGFWQLLEGTAKDYNLEVNNEVDERYHLEKATEAFCKYILESYEKYGSWTLAAGSYNAGRRGIDRQIDKQGEDNYYNLLLYEETARYIYRIIAVKLIYSNPAKYGFMVKKENTYPIIPTVEIKVDSSIKNISEFAKVHNTNYKMIKYFNPWLRENYLNNKNKKNYYIKIPKKNARIDNRFSNY